MVLKPCGLRESEYKLIDIDNKVTVNKKNKCKDMATQTVEEMADTEPYFSPRPSKCLAIDPLSGGSSSSSAATPAGDDDWWLVDDLTMPELPPDLRERSRLLRQPLMSQTPPPSQPRYIDLCSPEL